MSRPKLKCPSKYPINVGIIINNPWRIPFHILILGLSNLINEAITCLTTIFPFIFHTSYHNMKNALPKHKYHLDKASLVILFLLHQ